MVVFSYDDTRRYVNLLAKWEMGYDLRHVVGQGDLVLFDGVWSEVIEVRVHEAGEHPQSPIRDTFAAFEVVTTNGSRWLGDVKRSHDQWL